MKFIYLFFYAMLFLPLCAVLAMEAHDISGLVKITCWQDAVPFGNHIVAYIIHNDIGLRYGYVGCVIYPDGSQRLSHLTPINIVGFPGCQTIQILDNVLLKKIELRIRKAADEELVNLHRMFHDNIVNIDNTIYGLKAHLLCKLEGQLGFPLQKNKIR